MNRQSFAGLATGLMLLLSMPLQADEKSGVEFSGSGFLTLATGKIIHGDAPRDFNSYSAPIFVSDYAQAGVYESNGWSFKPDSRLGLQGTATFSPQFSVTGQIVTRAAHDGKTDLEWAYGNYHLSDSLTFQFGRKRLPLFYYSETQDVGFSYPWTHLPSGQYGWEIVNYNGANLLFRNQWETWSGALNIFAGKETRTENGFWEIYNGKGSRTDSRWSSIVGMDMTLTRGWLETRAAYIQSKIQNRFEDTSASPPYEYSPEAKQKIYSLSFRADHQNWLVHNEYLYMDRKSTGEEDYSFLLGVGYRIGKLLPMLTYNHYKMKLTPDHVDASLVDPASIDPLAAEEWSILALSLRYELTHDSVIKLQIDQWKDRNAPAFNNGVPYGNPRLISLSYDRVF